MQGLFPMNVGQAAPMAAVPPPPMAAPQVYAGNPNCPVPAIQMFQAPPCPDPNNSLQITKRVFEVVNGAFFVADTGTEIVSDFAADLVAGPDAGGVPGAGSFTLVTDAQTFAVVRDVTIAFDAYGANAFEAVEITAALESYATSFGALLSGAVTIENQPFPTVIPIASAIKNTGGIDSYWTVDAGDTSLPAGHASIYYVAPRMEPTHSHAPAPIEIYLPESSQYPVTIAVPSRASNGGAWNFDTGAGAADQTFIWTGVVTILLEQNTTLGNVPGAAYMGR